MKLRVVYFICICFLIVQACKQEEYVRDYPQILSTTLKSNTEQGISIEGAMGGVHLDQVIDHGFLWGMKGNLTSEKSFGVHFGQPTSTLFSAELQSQLAKDVTYVIRAFLKTDKTIILGEPITFTSLGSSGAVIHSVSPTAVKPGDVITITGERFGTDASQVQTWLHFPQQGDATLAIKTIKDNQITATVPIVAFSTAKVAVSRVGDGNVAFSPETVSGRQPMLTNLVATDICSSFRIDGTDLLLLGTPTAVKVNSKAVTPLPAITDNSITIPASFHSSMVTVQVTYTNAYSFSSSLTDPVAPTVTSVPTSFSSAHTFTLEGTNLPVCGGLSITSQPYAGLTISNITETQVTVNVAPNACDPFKLTLMYNGMIVFTSDNINPPPAFTVNSVSPLSGKPGDQITITGTGLDGVVVVLQNDILPTTGNSTQIQATLNVPNYDASNGLDGVIQILGCYKFDSYDFHLDLPTITIADVNPKVSNGYDEFVLTGTNFLSDPNLNVKLVNAVNGSWISEMQISSVNDTQIRLSPQYNYYSGNATLVIYSHGTVIASPQIQIMP